jgi:hypothetical protein
VNVRVGDDSHDCGGRVFDCRQIRFAKFGLEDEAVSTTFLLLHPEVKGVGLVFATTEVKRRSGKTQCDEELVGYGTSTRTLWGRSESDMTHPAPAPTAPPSTLCGDSLGLSLKLPAFAPAAVGSEPAIPFTYRTTQLEVCVKVLKRYTPLSPEVVRTRMLSDASARGKRLVAESELQLGDSKGDLFEFEGDKSNIYWLSVERGERGWFVVEATVPLKSPVELVAVVREILASLRLGNAEEKDRRKPSRIVYCDGTYGFRLELPDRPMVARFDAAPVLGTVNECVELHVGTQKTLESVKKRLSESSPLIVSTETSVSGHTALLVEQETAGDGWARMTRFLTLAVPLSERERTVVVTCCSPVDEFARRRPDFKKCLDSLELR